MILAQSSAAQAEKWNREQRSINDDLGYAAGVLKPFADRESQHCYDDEERYQRAGDYEDEPFISAQRIESEGVGDVGGDGHSLGRHEQDDIEPQIPAHQKADEIVEAEL